MAQHPGGDLPDLRHRASEGSSSGVTQQPDVTPDGGVAPAVSHRSKFLVKDCSGGLSVAPPHMQVVGEPVQQPRTTGPWSSEQLVDLGGAVEAAHRVARQTEFSADRRNGQPLGLEGRDLRETTRRALHEKRTRLASSEHLTGEFPPLLAIGGGSTRLRFERRTQTVVMRGNGFSTVAARLCHRCQRSATPTASGAPVRAASA
ncbi:hypothetical protein YT1_p20045 (plasmid) [Rhodococcus ruber]|nr:hypothetical protein YT1_p20045 [Rhodococcus ruber]